MNRVIRTSIRGLLVWAIGLVVVSAAMAAEPVPQELKLTVGKSIVIDYPADIARISTSNADVVDAVAVSSREVLLNGKAFGNSTVVIWSKSGERTFFSVTVDQNLEPIRKLLKDTFPNETIEVRATRDSLSLNGNVSSQAVADRAVALVTPLAKTVVNNLQVLPAGADKQIVLRVKFAELNRSILNSFGVNLLSTGALNTPGRVTTGQFPSGVPGQLQGVIPSQIPGTTTNFTLSDVLNVFAFRPDLNLAAIIRALQNQNVLQILAEPNLVTSNGKEASFLVGGEFPVPILQGGANIGAITIQFREFGIRLTFLPNVTAYGTIKMHVKPEVSTIDLANAVTFSGFTIPALATRRMETNIELGEGQSFVIGGLLDDRVTENLSKIPGLAHIPILGNFFKSKSESKTKTELIVMVTPEVTHPVQPTEPKPSLEMPKKFLPPLRPPDKEKAGPPPA